MIDRLHQFLDKHRLTISDKAIVVGVSTGVDSMVLLHALYALHSGANIIVAHINHQKRVESNHEETFIRQFCLEHQLRCYVYTLPLEECNDNFQEYARNKRYQFFFEVMEKENAQMLFLAHHLNDDIETMLMRLIRGSNLIGYAGIQPFIKEGNHLILRPFLDLLKEELLAYATKHNVPYFEDSSNKEDIYTRNRIRNHLVPEIFKENPQAHLPFLAFKAAMIEINYLLEKEKADMMTHIFTLTKHDARFKQQDFIKLKPFYQAEVLFDVLKPFSFGKVNIDEVIRWIHSNKPNLKIVYKGITFVKEYEDIQIYFYEVENKEVYLVVNQIGEYQIDSKRIVKVMKKTDNSLANSHNLWYNSAMLPIVIRSKKVGDKISVQSGTKKIKKILIDEKVGISKREDVLICEKDGMILSVFGYAKSNDLMPVDQCDIIIELYEEKKQ